VTSRIRTDVPTTTAALHARPIWTRVRRQRYLLAMLAPAFVLTLLFSYLPLGGWVLAFKSYRLGTGIFSGQWTGLLQFRRFFVDSSDFAHLIRNTLVINVVSVAQNLAVALIFAILLSEVRLKSVSKAVQTVTFFPYFISWVITYSVVWSLLAVRSGAINQFLVQAGVLEKGINVLGEARHAWPLMIYLNLWKYTGYNCIIFLAAISGIPQEQYEAAAIDGAGRFARVWYITVRHLVPTLAILLIMNSGWILNSNLEQFFVFTNSTNWENMEVLDMYIYKFGLKLLDYPYATAVGILKTGVSVLLLVVVNWGSKRIAGSGIF
jgi:putative aldouronate transport system permease protein